MNIYSRTRLFRAIYTVAGLLLLTPNLSAQVVLPQQDNNCLSCHSAIPATFANVVDDKAAGCDYRDASLYSGWGWNANTSESCPPRNSPTDTGAYAHDGTAEAEELIESFGCDYSNAANYDGWGWNDLAMLSCPPKGTVLPLCQYIGSYDSDNDGWGIEGGEFCQIDLALAGTDETLSSDLECVDSDGDGWGWNGFDSCVVNSSVTTQPVEGSTNDYVEVLPAPTIGPFCGGRSTPGWGVTNSGTSCQIPTDPLDTEYLSTRPCIDLDGDGFGWNGVESCMPTTSVAVARPTEPSPFQSRETDANILVCPVDFSGYTDEYPFSFCEHACNESAIAEQNYPGMGWNATNQKACVMTEDAPTAITKMPVYAPERVKFDVVLDRKKFIGNDSIWACRRQFRETLEEPFSIVHSTINWWQFRSDGTYQESMSNNYDYNPLILLSAGSDRHRTEANWYVEGRRLGLDPIPFGRMSSGLSSIVFSQADRVFDVYLSHQLRSRCIRRD